MRTASRLRQIAISLILFLTCGFTLTACFGEAAATKSELPVGVDQTLKTAIDTLFTWRPAFDKSAAAAFQRARPYVTPEVLPVLMDLENERPTQWDTWAKQGAFLTPTFTIQPAPGTTDTYTQYTRWVSVTQHIRNANGENLGDITFDLQPVVLTFADGAWRISKIVGLEKAGGGICPRNLDGTCRTPGQDQTTPTTAAPAPAVAATSTTTPPTTTTTTAPGILPTISLPLPTR